jgi:hypothetical protein
MGPARTTSAQLAGLRTAFGRTRECQTTWMSATVDHEVLRTVDHDLPTDVVRLSEADRAGPLALRLDARKEVVRLDLVGTGEGAAVVDQAVLERAVDRPLSEEQAEALRGVTTSGNGVDVVEALAGTGKTFTAGALRQAYEDAGYHVSRPRRPGREAP